jgi:hypothetical protein
MLKSASLNRPMTQQQKYLFTTLSTLLFLALIMEVFVVVTHKNLQKGSVQVFPTPIIQLHAIATGDGSYVIPTNISDQMKFVSPKLGISFLYMDNYGGHVLTKEEGSKVYLYDNEDHKISEHLEVFSKNSIDNLKTAIQKSILAGYSASDCFVKKIQTVPGQAVEDTEEAVVIDFPYSNEYGNPSSQKAIEAANKCPEIYRGYFIVSKNHPDKFVFIRLFAQIPSFPAVPYDSKQPNNTKYWINTLQFTQ